MHGGSGRMPSSVNMDRQKTLYVGNLSSSVTEDFLMYLFSNVGQCKGCKIIKEPGAEPYAFVEFEDHETAQAALQTMNKRSVLGQEMKVNWATSPAQGPKMDTSKHFHVFVGDLSQDIDADELRRAFEAFGEISDVKVVRDPNTMKSKGYGFVSFVKKTDAENAITSMNGQWLGNRAIRTNWATRKPQSSSSGRQLSYDDVFNQASPTNTTVYCGNIVEGLTEDLIRSHFYDFGTIVDVRVFRDKGFAFIKYDTKQSACQAICQMHGQEVNGYVVKCSWGKEGDMPQANSGGGHHMNMGNSGVHHMNMGGGMMGGMHAGPSGHHMMQSPPGSMPGPMGGHGTHVGNNVPPAMAQHAGPPTATATAPGPANYAAYQQYCQQYYQQMYQQWAQQQLQGAGGSNTAAMPSQWGAPAPGAQWGGGAGAQQAQQPPGGQGPMGQMAGWPPAYGNNQGGRK